MIPNDAKIVIVGSGAGKMDYYKLLAGKGKSADLKRFLTLRIIGFK